MRPSVWLQKNGCSPGAKGTVTIDSPRETALECMSASECGKEEGVVPTIETPERVALIYSVNRQGTAAG